jgi:hypothetical protein
VLFFLVLYTVSPKTSAGTRFLPVPRVLAAFLAVTGLRLALAYRRWLNPPLLIAGVCPRIYTLVFLAPGSGPMTKSDFAAGFRRISEKVRIEPRQDVKDVGVSGDLGYAWSRFTIVHTTKADGARSERSGHVLAVFRKNAAGAWQLARTADLTAGARGTGKV